MLPIKYSAATPVLGVIEAGNISPEIQLDLKLASFKTDKKILNSTWNRSYRFASIERLSRVHPDFVYFVSSAVHGDDPNNNGDLFRWGSIEDSNEPELLRFDDKVMIGGQRQGGHIYQTFIKKGLFIEHNSHDPKNAIGINLDAVPNFEDRSIEVVSAIDKKRSPEIARGVQSGYITDVSMGAAVGYSICSVCNNIAHKILDYCDHIKYNKASMYSGQDTNGQLQYVYEDNRNVGFIELSIVTTGADSKAKVIVQLANKLRSQFPEGTLYQLGQELDYLGIKEGSDSNVKEIQNLVQEALRIIDERVTKSV